MNRWMKIINKFNIIAIYLTSVVNYYFKKGIFQNIKLAWYIFKTNRAVIQYHNLLCACAKTTYILLSLIILLFYYIFFVHLIVLNCCFPLFLSIIFLLLTLSRFILFIIQTRMYFIALIVCVLLKPY